MVDTFYLTIIPELVLVTREYWTIRDGINLITIPDMSPENGDIKTKII